MTQKRLFFILLFFGLCIQFLNAQKKEDTLKVDYQDFIDANFGLPDEQIDYAQSYESLFQFLFNPIDLNNTNRQELRSINILSDSQIKSFFKFMAENGSLLTLYEVASIPGFSEETLQKLLPYVTVKASGMDENLSTSDLNALLRRVLEDENNYFILQYARTAQQQIGYKKISIGDREFKPRFAGSQDRILGRFRASNPNDFSIGLTFEKDPGEAFIFDPETNRHGFDFYSFHLSLENKGHLKSFTTGDYQLQFGQGLLLGAGFSYGKGSETVETTRRSTLGIVPYSSVYESGFFRGAAATLKFKNVEVTGFYSNRNIDQPEYGNTLHPNMIDFFSRYFDVDPDEVSSSATGDYEEYLSSIQSSGLHRTPAEIRRKGRINEQVGGGNISFTSKNEKIHFGSTAMVSAFDPEIDLRIQEYNKFEFSGDHNFNLGLYYDLTFGNFNLFGEGAFSESKGTGMVTGIKYSPGNRFNLALLYRNYEKNFHSLYGLAFSENYRTINEQGLYVGFKFNISSKVGLNAYFDKFSFPWSTFRTQSASEGYDYLVQLNYRPSWKFQIYGQYRHEVDEINIRNDLRSAGMLEKGIRDFFVLNFEYAATKTFNGRTRLQYTAFSFDGSPSSGYAIIQDFGIQIKKWSFNGQISAFDADDLETSQYIFQKDVLYDFTFPFYQNKGVNGNVLIQVDPFKNLSLWGKISYTHLFDVPFIGDIYDIFEIIPGNEQTDLKFQMMYRF